MDESAPLAGTSGFRYYFSPPRTLHAALVDPIHTVLYILFMTSVCAIFSKTWIEVSVSGPRDIAKQLKVHQLLLPPSLPLSVLSHGPGPGWLPHAVDVQLH